MTSCGRSNCPVPDSGADSNCGVLPAMTTGGHCGRLRTVESRMCGQCPRRRPSYRSWCRGRDRDTRTSTTRVSYRSWSTTLMREWRRGRWRNLWFLQPARPRTPAARMTINTIFAIAVMVLTSRPVALFAGSICQWTYKPKWLHPRGALFTFALEGWDGPSASTRPGRSLQRRWRP